MGTSREGGCGTRQGGGGAVGPGTRWGVGGGLLPRSPQSQPNAVSGCVLGADLGDGRVCTTVETESGAAWAVRAPPRAARPAPLRALLSAFLQQLHGLRGAALDRRVVDTSTQLVKEVGKPGSGLRQLPV